jgi:protein gp37
LGETSIEWTKNDDGSAGKVWNPVRGCSRVSPGCGGPGKFGGCYAEKIAARFSNPGQAFHGFAERKGGEARWTGKMALVEDMLTLPLKWRKPTRIFANSMSDLFHEKLPDEAIDRVFAVMALAPQHAFMVLTKRPARLRSYLSDHKAYQRILDAAAPLRAERRALGSIPISDPTRGAFWSQVALGVSVEDQIRADERRDDIAAVAAQRWATFISYEPALGPVDWTGWEFTKQIICGGESGARARPSNLAWFRETRDFCAPRGIAFFMKQLSGRGARAIKDMAEFPEDLRVREMPRVAA